MMPDVVRAKMQLVSKVMADYGYGPPRVTLRFETRYDDKIPEEARFQKATPTGSIEMQVDNPTALAVFDQVGGNYYLDFIPIPAV
jgi:hypothetical protein